jgi:hypothetical protein
MKRRLFGRALLTLATLSALLFFFSTNAVAQCDGGRIPCSHACDSGTRPACKDSKGSGAKPHCVTPRFCRDNGNNASRPACDPGFSPRNNGCSQAERATRGCQDKRGPGGGICVRFTR